MEEKEIIRGSSEGATNSFIVLVIIALASFLFGFKFFLFFYLTGISVLAIIILSYYSSRTVVVTNRRVYVRTQWIFINNRISIPLDSFSSVGAGSNGLFSISSPSCRIRCFCIDNNVELEKVLVDILLERQAK